MSWKHLGSSTGGRSIAGRHSAGALGGDNCPLNGKYRNTTVHTAQTTVRGLYEELKAKRGYVMDFGSLNVSVQGKQIDVSAASNAELCHGISVNCVGPNRGG